MDCNGFKHWLLTRDGDEEEMARHHREVCPDCLRLYAVDEKLEQALSTGMRATAPTSGLAWRAKKKATAEGKSTTGSSPAWYRKGLTPAFAIILVLIFFSWNPFAESITSLDAIGDYALANHNQDDMQMAFTVDDTPDPQAWFFERLNFRITLPDFRTRGFTLLGGRECSIGPHKAAYLFYDVNGETVSLFILPAGKFKLALQDERHYRIESARHQMDLWKTDGMICILVQNRLAVVSPTV